MTESASYNNAVSQAAPRFHLLIVAAGAGVRTGFDVPKQYAVLAGKSLLRHTVEAFLCRQPIESITIVISAGQEEQYAESLQNLLNDPKLRPYVLGGNDRKSSVYNGLKSLSNLTDKDIVLVHDAARPFIKPSDLSSLFSAFKNPETKAASLACLVADTLRRSDSDDEENIFGEIVLRDNLWQVQTPQAFQYPLLKEAHESADPHKPYTDDTSLISDCGIDVAIVPCGRHNFKITTKEDFDMAEQLLRAHSGVEAPETRTGSGFDVHAFCDEDKPLLVCGVEIPYERSLAGHSDADVGLHAITDALLGAIGAGDIGDHFPPSDMQWKGKDSAYFLRKSLKIALSQGARINNIDVTIICEAPKLFAFKQAMKQRVAAICNIEPSRVNVKATTTEKLGFTGRKEGIAAQACVTVSVVRGSAPTLAQTEAQNV